MKPVRKHVFRAYDIRGVVDVDFDEEWVFRLGQALGQWYLAKDWSRVVVGHDCRASSPAYFQAVTHGLVRAGLDVVRIGMVSTPLFYHAAKTLGMQAGVMVTASHNPSEYNGFKLWGGDTVLTPEEIAGLYEIMVAGRFQARPGVRLISSFDPTPAYLEDLCNRERIERPLKVVVDGGNGACGELTAQLLERAGAEVGVEVVRLYCEPDGSFPNHHPDPVVEANTAALQAEVLRLGADAGVGLDGDGDRIGVVDETGRLWPGDRLLALYARDVLQRAPGARIIGDVKCSHLFFRDVEKHGGIPVMGVTGHSIMKAALRAEGAALAGEMSGHMFFGHGFYGWDDGAYAALRLLAILSRSGKPLSGLLADWPATMSTPEIRVSCPEALKFQVVELARKYLQAEGKALRLIDVDGVRVVIGEGWGLVRASNTQAELTYRFEAESAAQLDEIQGLVQEAVNRALHELTG